MEKPNEGRFTAMPKALFSTELDQIATGFLKAPERADPDRSLQRQYGMALAGAAEALLISPRVSFRVYGENVVLACLVRLFGAAEVERLLDDGTIEFILWNGLVASLQTDDLIRQGVDPLTYGMGFTTPNHSDPDQSNLSGLRWAPKLDRKIRRNIARKATRRTIVTSAQSPREAVEATMQAFRDGMFGDPADTELPIVKRNELLATADQLFEAAVLIEHELDLHEGAATWTRVLRLANEVRSSVKVPRVVEELLRAEDLPAIRHLIIKQLVAPSDILKWRMRREVKDFQEWLWTRPDPADSADVLEGYRRLIFKDSFPVDNRLTEHIRLVGLSAAGAVIGDLATRAFNIGVGGEGAAVGAVAGFALNTTVATVLGEGDKLIDRIVKRQPRRFASLIRDSLLNTRQS